MSKPPAPRGRRPGAPVEKKRGVKHGKGSKVAPKVAPRPAAAKAPAKPAAPKVDAKPAKALKPSTAVVLQFRVAEDDDGIRLDRWFKRHMPDVSFATVSRWARTGQLRVDGARAEPGARLQEGQMIRVPPAEAREEKSTRPLRQRERAELTDEQIDFAQSLVIYRDPQAIVINKPAGLATQGVRQVKIQ